MSKKDDRTFGTSGVMDCTDLSLDEVVYAGAEPTPPAALMGDIADNGVKKPLFARAVNGENRVIVGARRLACAKGANPPQKVPVVVLEDIDDDEALLLHTISNIFTRDLPSSEKGRLLIALHQPVYDMHKRHREWPPGNTFNNMALIGTVSGKSPHYIYQERCIDGLPDEIKHCLDKGILTRRKACGITKQGDKIPEIADAIRLARPQTEQDVSLAIGSVEGGLQGNQCLDRAARLLERAERLFLREDAEAPDPGLVKSAQASVSAIKKGIKK
ncbi:MAG: ParB/RepB/Spo0J family partition protein [Eggerthellaceae bacterium]|nr:ParB/RepB/Spo0J family partition protein [Eggerthellaceae bacterium]